jgi:hypothetical protein
MAHYALINSDNIVVNVFAGIDENITQTDSDGNEIGGSSINWENFYTSIHSSDGLYCKRTSYNGNIRANYAGKGYVYDSEFDVFIGIKPFPSWKLNYTTYQWEAPVAKPEPIDGYVFRWSELNKEWIQIALPE